MIIIFKNSISLYRYRLHSGNILILGGVITLSILGSILHILDKYYYQCNKDYNINNKQCDHEKSKPESETINNTVETPPSNPMVISSPIEQKHTVRYHD